MILFRLLSILQLMLLEVYCRPQEGCDEIFAPHLCTAPTTTTTTTTTNAPLDAGDDCEIFGTCTENRNVCDEIFDDCGKPATTTPQKPRQPRDCFNDINDIDSRRPAVHKDCQQNRQCSFHKAAGYACVLGYQCKNKTIITDGKGLIDVRGLEDDAGIFLDASDSKCDTVDKICCKNPDYTAKPPPTLTEKPVEELQTTVSKYAKCGRSSPGKVHVSQSGRDSAQPTEFPHMCVLFKMEGGKEKYIGGGSLIATNKILTVAHKFLLTRKGVTTDHRPQKKQYFVRCGEYNLAGTTGITETQESTVEDILIHPQYNPKKVTNNLAIIRTKENFIYEEHIGPVCLPRPNEAFDNDKGHDCWSCGWGSDNFDDTKISDILRKVQLGVVDRHECENKLQKVPRFSGKGFKLDPSWMCIGGEPGKDTCKGDGGSPHVCKLNNAWYQVGAVAWGVDCGKALPSIYSSIPKAMCWIDYVMSCLGDADSNVKGVSVDVFDIRGSSNTPQSINGFTPSECQQFVDENPDLMNKCEVIYDTSVDERTNNQF